MMLGGEEAWAFVGVVGTVAAYLLANRITSEAQAAATGAGFEEDESHSDDVAVADSDSVLQKRRGRDTVSLGFLKELVYAPTIHLRSTAMQLILERAMSDRHFPHILYHCWDDTNPELKEKAISAISQLSKIEDNRGMLVKWGVIKMLVHVLATKNTESTHRNAVVTLYRLVSNSTRRKISVVKMGVLDQLTPFLTSHPTHSNDLKYWALLLVHQFSLTEKLHRVLLKKDLVPILARMTRLTFGNTNMQKYCLHSLVRLVSDLENQEAETQLNKLLDLNMAPMITACLRNEDSELVSWAIYLLQEFVIKEATRSKFYEISALPRTLLSLLTSSETTIPRVTLRVLKCMGMRHDDFQKELLKVGVLKKTVPLIKSNDVETQFWALALLHDLLLSFEHHDEFFKLDGLKFLIDITGRANLALSLYISDIFIFLCGSGRNRDIVLNSSLVDAVFVLIKSSESDLQYAGSLLLLNLVTFSEVMVNKILKRNGLSILSKFLASPRADIQILAAKTLSTMARKDPTVRTRILEEIIQPMALMCIKDMTSFNFEDTLGVDLEALQIFLLPHSLGFSGAPLFSDFGMDLEPLCAGILDVLLLPFIDDSEPEPVVASPTVGSLPMMSLRDELPFDLVFRLKELEMDYHVKELMVTNDLNYSTRELLAIRALFAISTLFIFESARRYFETHDIFILLVQLIRSRSKSLARQSILCLAVGLHLGLQRSYLAMMPEFLDTILKFILFDGHPLSNFYGQMALDCISDHTETPVAERTYAYVGLDLNSITPYLCISRNKMEVRNDSWTFESVRGTVSISGSGKYGYEVLLSTDGIMQVGWATSGISFDPEGGEGIGDNEFSFAYDGHRTKKWHSFHVSDNTYGEEWFAGDIITALLDLDEGTISYLRNGNELGIAFEGISTDSTWFPAVSLASSQGCSFFFGSKCDPIRYLPEDYSPISPPVDMTDLESDSELKISYDLKSEYRATIMDSYHIWSIPSFYYEVTLGFGHAKDDIPIPFQLGLSDGESTAYLITPLSPSSMALVLVRTEGISDSLILQSLHTVLYVMGRNSPASSDDGEVGVYVVGVVDGLTPKDGAVFGVGYLESEGMIMFTYDGSPLDLAFTGVPSGVFPYFRNLPQFVSNYGNSAFRWYPEEEGDQNDDEDDFY